MACLFYPRHFEAALVVVMSLPAVIGPQLVGQRGDITDGLKVIGTNIESDVDVWAVHKISAAKLEELKAASPPSEATVFIHHGAPTTARLNGDACLWEERVDVGEVLVAVPTVLVLPAGHSVQGGYITDPAVQTSLKSACGSMAALWIEVGLVAGSKWGRPLPKEIYRNASGSVKTTAEIPPGFADGSKKIRDEGICIWLYEIPAPWEPDPNDIDEFVRYRRFFQSVARGGINALKHHNIPHDYDLPGTSW